MSIYPKTIYARVVNPGTEDEYMVTGTELNDVSDTAVDGGESVATTIGRYQLVGEGEIHYTAPRYIEKPV